MRYISIIIGNKAFDSGKIVIVKVDKTLDRIQDYVLEAFKTACDSLGVDPHDSRIFDYQYLGEDVTFII